MHLDFLQTAMSSKVGSATSYVLKSPSDATNDLVNERLEQNERLHESNYCQVSILVAVLAIAMYALFEPFIPEGYSSLKLFAFIGKSAAGQPSTVKKMVYVLQSACLPLLCVVLADMLKEYRHAVYDATHQSEHEIVLSEQMKMASQAKLAERVHVRTLSQLLVLVVCQLALVTDTSLPSNLTRIVPITNGLYLTSRVIDLLHSSRLRLLTNMTTYFPLLLFILFIVSRQLYHNFFSTTNTRYA